MKWISDLCNDDGSEVLCTVKDGIQSIQQSLSCNEEVVLDLSRRLEQFGKNSSENTSALPAGRQLSNLATGKLLPMNWINYGLSTTRKPKTFSTKAIGSIGTATKTTNT